MDRRQLTQYIFERVKPLVDSTIPQSEADIWGTAYFNNLTVAKVLPRTVELGRACVFGEMISATNPADVGDYVCPADLNYKELAQFNPANVIPQDTGGRILSHVSLCEGVALFGTSIKVSGTAKTYYSVDGFKSKVAAASGVAVSSIVFAKSGSVYTVTSAQRAYITSAYQQFYPGETPSSAVVDKLSAVVTSTSASSTVTSDPAWTNLFLAICLSPGWQNL